MLHVEGKIYTSKYYFDEFNNIVQDRYMDKRFLMKVSKED